MIVLQPSYFSLIGMVTLILPLTRRSIVFPFAIFRFSYDRLQAVSFVFDLHPIKVDGDFSSTSLINLYCSTGNIASHTLVKSSNACCTIGSFRLAKLNYQIHSNAIKQNLIPPKPDRKKSIHYLCFRSRCFECCNVRYDCPGVA